MIKRIIAYCRGVMDSFDHMIIMLMLMVATPFVYLYRSVRFVIGCMRKKRSSDDSAEVTKQPTTQFFRVFLNRTSRPYIEDRWREHMLIKELGFL